jgi:hypothetical protein
VIGAFAVLVAVVAVILRGGGGATGPALGPANPAPAGAMAVANVLRAHGVTVVAADTMAEARAAARGGADTTALVYDPNGYLDARHLRALRSLAASTVLVRPDFATLRALAPHVTAAGAPLSTTATIPARCDLPAAEKAGRISAPQSTYRLTTAADAGDTGCFPSANGRFALVVDERSSHRVAVVGSTHVFDNENTVRTGNAALALNLLGEHQRLVWYLPTLADATPTGPPSLGQLTPGWVTPVMLLAIVAVIAAAVWRGRRFGPLVIENLPVVVRAEETMEGRARLYQRSSARLRAADALRIGATGRIASRCGLPRSAGMAEIVAAAAAVTGWDPRSVADVLITAVPQNEAQLVALSRRLTVFENAVRAATGTAATSAQSPNDHDRPGD